jgi:hypothetical protein
MFVKISILAIGIVLSGDIEASDNCPGSTRLPTAAKPTTNVAPGAINLKDIEISVEQYESFISALSQGQSRNIGEYVDVDRYISSYKSTNPRNIGELTSADGNTSKSINTIPRNVEIGAFKRADTELRTKRRRK